MDRRFFIQTMMGGLAASAAGASLLDELPEWFLDPPKGKSMVVVPREVRLVLPKRTVTTELNGVRYVARKKGNILLPYRGSSDQIPRSSFDVVRIERKGEREVTQEKTDGIWRIPRKID